MAEFTRVTTEFAASAPLRWTLTNPRKQVESTSQAEYAGSITVIGSTNPSSAKCAA